ncbi:Fur family transcriptional regulator, partial [Kitasatospora cineracea]|uniref:Fur family transcriptional regulator n=1 Tax=Kitasatospora cineracea TaxID=88074 RepID=UPI0033E99DC3
MTTAGPSPRARSTRQRTAVSAVLDEIEDFRSAQELHDMLKHRGDSVGLTTVYRTLQSLAEAGEVDVLRTAEGEAVYRRCSSGHHHHLVCRHCGATVEVEGPAVERCTPRGTPAPRPAATPAAPRSTGGWGGSPCSVA